jgi:hypothetical protein
MKILYGKVVVQYHQFLVSEYKLHPVLVLSYSHIWDKRTVLTILVAALGSKKDLDFLLTY